jgi:methionyl aminopeptidase
MDKAILEKYLKAGGICAEIRKEIQKKLSPGVKILDIAEEIEKKISDKGGSPAFPVNISINELAAHYTPTFNDTTEIKEGDLVKIDIGVHVDGYIGDMAFTYCSESNPLIKANEKILRDAEKALRPGISVAEIGEKIDASAKEQGVGLIVNLTGHTLDKYIFHGSPSIPNIPNNSTHTFNAGDVIALEPFVVESNSHIKESYPTEIYRYIQDRPVRLMEARKILALARDDWKSLPFCKRWLARRFSPVKASA